ncbi:MAG: DNA double-strand break repair nuclease NurA [Promethearchaeota archaeon]
MTIRNNFINIKDKGLNFLSKEKKVNDNFGFTKEQLLLNNLKALAERFKELEKLKDDFSKTILKNLMNLDFSRLIEYPRFYIKEKFLKKTITGSNITGLNVISVDGSFVSKKYMNVDFSFLKAIAVKYIFKKNTIANIKYYPDINGFNNYYVQGNFFNRDENAVDTKISMDMRHMEINLLNNLIERSSDIDVVIIDGSIVITPINLLFSKDPEISKRYDNLLKEYHTLYSSCKDEGIILIGSIKDTRTSALTNLLTEAIQLLKPNHSNLADFTKINYRDTIEFFSDIDLFNRLLEKNERSCIFKCKNEIDKIRDTGIKKEIPYYFPLSFYAFYLKTARYDTPCRIEYFMDENHSIKKASEKADLITSILLPISSLNEHYGLPIPQIEAHKRAVFKTNEVGFLFNNLIRTLHKYGITLLEKRRNRRPF